MPDVNLNEKVFGVKAKIHFFIFAAALIFPLGFLLLAFIDASNLSSKVDKEVSGQLNVYLTPIPSTFILATIGPLVLYCCPYKILYGICGVLMGIFGALGGFGTFLSIFLDFEVGFNYLLPGYEKSSKIRKKYWKNGEMGLKIQGFLTTLTYLYFAIVLCKLAFFKAPPPPVVRRKITRVKEEENKSEDSEKSGQFDKTGRSGKSGKSGPSVEEE